MKKIRILLIAIVAMMFATTNVFAASYTKDYKDWDNTEMYTLTISSETLPSGLVLAGSANSIFSYADEDYKIFSEYLYNYSFQGGTVMGPVDILISQDNLVEGTKYDVYYVNGSYPYTVLEEYNGDEAEVVKIDGKLYISFAASTINPFVLNMHESNEYKAEWAKINNQNFFSFPGIKPTRTIDDGFDFYTYFMVYDKLNTGLTISPVDEFRLENEFQYMTLTFDSIPNETHVVKYKWTDNQQTALLKSEMAKIEASIAEVAKPMTDFGGPSSGLYFEIEDLNYINYLNNVDVDEDFKIVNYSSDLRNVFKNTNYKYYFDFRAGNGCPFENLAFGYMSIVYNGIIVPLNIEGGYLSKQVLYVSDDTADTNEDVIAALTKRIKDYLNSDEFTIEVGGLRSALVAEEEEIANAWESFYDVDKMYDSYFVVTINGHETQFVVEKNSKKIASIEYKIKDLLTDVEISTKSGELPYDTIATVNKIDANSATYRELLSKLNKTYGDIFDIKLFSDSLDTYFTKLDNGMFEVRVPLKPEYVGKDLSAYYIDDENKIEEYEITIDGNCAVFQTNHFSTYTIAEASNVPNTIDNVGTYIILVTFSSLLIATSYVILRNNIKKSKKLA